MDKNWQAELYNISETELDSVVWRYLTFPKFIHLVSNGALWFCRLDHLIDKYEGHMPKRVLAEMRKDDEKTKEFFPQKEIQEQIDNWPEDNIRGGRLLTAVNCWYIGANESAKMWEDYVKNPEGVAIRSTVQKVRESIYLPAKHSFIGKVNYVDFETYEMSTHEAHQAHHRAFLKDKNKFRHERELRVSTMNFKTLACLDKYGKPYEIEEVTGANMNNLNVAGLHIRVDLKHLFDSVIMAPGSPDWFKDLITHLSLKNNFNWNIEDSKIEASGAID